MSPARSETQVDSARAFSLVEALVALAVFALAGVGLVQLQTQSLGTLSAVERRALGAMVAQNELVELVAGSEPPALGSREGEENLAGRRWRWRLSAESSFDPRMRRLTVEVFEGASDEPTVSAHAFVAVSEVRP